MWCPTCRADVAGELSTDNRRMLCARCYTELGLAAGTTTQSSATPRTQEAERDARELLARWLTNSLLEVPAPVTPLKQTLKSDSSADLPAMPGLRFDLPKTTTPAPTASFMTAAASQPAAVLTLPAAIPSESAESRPAPAKQGAPFGPLPAPIAKSGVATQPHPTHTHESHHAHAAAHVHQGADHQTQARNADPSSLVIHSALGHKTPISTLAGQLCAYGGVGLLTCGTVMVMWSYYGGPASYMPTGWLIAAVGQMLLFLGVIAIISGGMEQTVAEVAWRIDHLAHEVHEMALSLDDLEHAHRHRGAGHEVVAGGQSADHQTREAA